MNHRSEKIAIIGAGIMGMGMASNLLRAGHFVNLYTRSPDKIHHLPEEEVHVLKGERARLFDSIPLACEDVQLIIICLTEDMVVRETFFEKGILDSKAPYIIDTGTTSPELTLQMFHAARQCGKSFLDAPMTGSKLAARNGQILFMVGGNERDIESLSYFFRACGKKHIHCGEVSSGQRAKIALNMVQAGLFQIYNEGFQLATKDQIHSKTFFEIVKESAAYSPLFEFKMNHVLASNFETHFALKNMNKDILHAMRQAKEKKVRLPLSEHLKEIYQEGMNSGFGEEDFCSLAKINERWNENRLNP